MMQACPNTSNECKSTILMLVIRFGEHHLTQTIRIKSHLHCSTWQERRAFRLSLHFIRVQPSICLGLIDFDKCEHPKPEGVGRRKGETGER